MCLAASQLYAELSQLNLNLPARVCVPLFDSTHQVLRVPTSEAVVLNSKSKVSPQNASPVLFGGAVALSPQWSLKCNAATVQLVAAN